VALRIGKSGRRKRWPSPAEALALLVAGAADVSVAAGTAIAAGDALGTMHSAPGAVLYFEVREHGRPIDPAPLLGVN
jgi:septal ring factor EnvC (AmiA/AmiB activator)